MQTIGYFLLFFLLAVCQADGQTPDLKGFYRGNLGKSSSFILQIEAEANGKLSGGYTPDGRNWGYIEGTRQSNGHYRIVPTDYSGDYFDESGVQRLKGVMSSIANGSTISGSLVVPASPELNLPFTLEKFTMVSGGYSGTIESNIKIDMWLDEPRVDGTLTGGYFYEKFHRNIFLYGKVSPDGTFVLYETGPDESAIGEFQGKFDSKDSAVSGSWVERKGALNSRRFSLVRKYNFPEVYTGLLEGSSSKDPKWNPSSKVVFHESNECGVRFEHPESWDVSGCSCDKSKCSIEIAPRRWRTCPHVKNHSPITMTIRKGDFNEGVKEIGKLSLIG